MWPARCVLVPTEDEVEYQKLGGHKIYMKGKEEVEGKLAEVGGDVESKKERKSKPRSCLLYTSRCV